MSSPNNETPYTDYTDAQYDEADRLVDTRHISYSEAFRIIGAEAEQQMPVSLNTQEIAEAVPVAGPSETGQAALLLSRITAARYPSELRDLRREVIKGIVTQSISPDDVDQAFQAIRDRRSQLIQPNDIAPEE